MNRKKYNLIKLSITLFVGIITALAITNNNYLLAVASIGTGIAFMGLIRIIAKMSTDERKAMVQEKAARTTYQIFVPTLGISALLMLVPTYSNFFVFSNGEFLYLESLGIIFAYLTLFLITLYSISVHIFNKKYGGDNEE